MSFINTADILGDQEVLDRLVSNTLTELNDDRLIKIKTYALYRRTALEQVNFPNLTTGASSVFSDCYSLENINLEKMSEIKNNSFSYCYNLKTINIPDVTKIADSAFYCCYFITNYLFNNIIGILGSSAFGYTGIKEAILYDLTSIYSSPFTYCPILSKIELMSTTKKMTLPTGAYGALAEYSNLTHFIIHYPSSVLTLGTYTLNNTPLAHGQGAIYVPENLVNDYKSATNWSVYADIIYPLEDYPVTINLGDTINDSWGTIFSNEEQHQHTNLYALGDTKTVMIGELPVLMQIVYMDENKIGWLSKDVIFNLPLTLDLGNGYEDWEHCYSREYLNSVVYDNIETTVKNKILSVENTYYDGSTTKTCNDKIFIPSRREIFGEGASRENSGNLFTTFFNDKTKRIKKSNRTNSETYWALRTKYNASSSNNSYNYVNSSGANASGGAPSGTTIAFYT